MDGTPEPEARSGVRTGASEGETAELLAAIRRGDSDAFETLARENAPALFRTALCLTGRREEAEDLVQEVLVRALPAAALWTLGAGAAGWLTGAMLRLDRADRFTFAIEFSAKNVGMAAIVALAGFPRPELAVFAGAYVAVGYPMAVVASLVFRRLHRVGDAVGA